MQEQKQLDLLIRHINNVRESCIVLGERLQEKGEIELGRNLIANGFIHDNSKFHGIEWLYLNSETKEKDPDLFLLAANQHITTNFHHPEYWGSIHEVPRIYLCEMVADWRSRSSEFGNDLRMWIKDKACEKYDMSIHSDTYKEIMEFVEILLEPSFK